MKANELMIGDWAFCTYPSINKPVRVAEIRTVSDNELKIVVYDDIRLVLNETYMDPIPLTPEILEKNGFEWNRYKTSLNLTCGTIHIGYGFYKDCLSVSDWADDGTAQIVSVECKYVHQLQHALRLCEIEKEIEL